MTEWDSLEQIAADVKSGKIKASDLVERSLSAIDQYSEHNAVIAKLEDMARSRAAEIDKQVADGKAEGKLLGVPFAIKDNFMLDGVEATAASNILKDFVSPITSTVLQRLLDEGAIPVARTNLDAFAHGASTENSDFGVTLNAKDKTKVAGGSSGGSAAAVALEIVPFALGSDTGGSIRQPASFNGVVGFKPSYGLNSRYGVVAMCSSTDCMGYLTSNTADVDYLIQITAGKDGHDSTVVDIDLQPRTKKVKGLKIGRIKQFELDGLADDVRSVYQQWLKDMQSAGAEVVDIDVPALEHAVPVYYIVQTAEVSSNLGRYDGMRYGFSDDAAESLEEVYIRSRTVGFGAENQRRLMLGTFVLNSGYYDAYYKKALQVRTLMIDQLNKALEGVDCVAGPTAPTTAFAVGDKSDDPLAMYLADVMTAGYSLTGMPAFSLPIGLGNGDLPVGVQLATKHGADADLLAISQAIEKVDRK